MQRVQQSHKYLPRGVREIQDMSIARKEKLDNINKERKKDCESCDRAREAVKRMQSAYVP